MWAEAWEGIYLHIWTSSAKKYISELSISLSTLTIRVNAVSQRGKKSQVTLIRGLYVNQVTLGTSCGITGVYNRTLTVINTVWSHTVQSGCHSSIRNMTYDTKVIKCHILHLRCSHHKIFYDRKGWKREKYLEPILNLMSVLWFDNPIKH